jgi:hypothetical protein
LRRSGCFIALRVLMLELLAAILSEFAFSAGPCRAELLNYLSLLTLALAFGKAEIPVGTSPPESLASDRADRKRSLLSWVHLLSKAWPQARIHSPRRLVSGRLPFPIPP